MPKRSLGDGSAAHCGGRVTAGPEVAVGCCDGERDRRDLSLGRGFKMKASR